MKRSTRPPGNDVKATTAAVAGESDFMSDLFADLDASIFSQPPSSSPNGVRTPTSSAGHSSSAPRRASYAPRDRVVVASTSASALASSSAASTSARTSVRKTSPPVQKRAVSLRPEEFWNDPLSRPYARPALVNTATSTSKPSLSVFVAKKRKSDGLDGVQGIIKSRERSMSTAATSLKLKGKEKENTPVCDDLNRQDLNTKRGMACASECKVGVSSEDLLEGIDFDDTMYDDDDEDEEHPPPRSKDFVRCVVEAIEEGMGPKRTLILEVSSERFEDRRQVVLADDWVQSVVEVGYTINVVGPFDLTASPSAIIDRLSGYLILHPDILVSSTKVADSAQCSRKALLQEIIRSSEGTNSSLVYGNMLHALMQACMLDNRWDDEYRKEKIQSIVQSEMQTLWSINKPGPIEAERAREEMWEKSRDFEQFSHIFVGDDLSLRAVLPDAHSVRGGSTVRLAISGGLAIEEDIWSPRFGLKGKIDITVAGKIAEGPFTRPGTFPFEIKTGKSSAGMEHRAQTMLYTLLMTDRYDEAIESGLLYYTQSNEVLRIQPARNELRGLLIARNEFATFLHRRLSLSADKTWLSSTPKIGDEDGEGPKPVVTLAATVNDVPASSQMSASEAALWAVATPPSAADAKPVELEDRLLPEPIDEARSCKRCYVRDACMLYRRAFDGDTEVTNDDSNGSLQQVYEDQTSSLTDTQLAFFRTWERLITLEEQEMIKFKKEIWTIRAEERQRLGRCLANMAIDPAAEAPVPVEGAPRVHTYTYCLRRATTLSTQATSTQRAADSLLGGTISVNDPIVITLEQPFVLAMSRGFVLEMSAHHIVVGVDHSLTDSPLFARARKTKSDQGQIYRIDKDELAAGMGRIRDNLVQLFVPGGDERRRELIVDLVEPQFYELPPVVDDAKLVTHSDLNGDQARAIDKVSRARDYTLILGMPGTGKTTTIAELLKALTKKGQSVLLTSYTHSAVDNILLKVKDQGLGILRLGNRDKIMPELHHLTLDPRDPATNLAQLDNRFMTPQIVATTCLGINEHIFSKRRFDVCIIDEASQVTLPTCLGPLRFADRFVLVGDHNQLPPLVRNPAARESGLDESLFARLSKAHPSAIVNLTIQYRMNRDIMLLSNRLVYDGELRVGSDSIADRRLALPGWERLEEGWCKDVVDPRKTVVFADTDQLPARERKQGSLIDNEGEARIVKEARSPNIQICKSLIDSGLEATELGLIAPYRHQIKLLSFHLGSTYPKIEILTADRSQGRDKLCIVMSLVRSNESGNVGDLLTDWRRLNVCLTRAKAKLIIVGSRKTLKHVKVLSRLFDIFEDESRQWIYELPKTTLGEEVRDEAAAPKAGSEKRAQVVGPGAKLMQRAFASDVANCL
ncbi:BQ5605_C005g03616 [Microbotryum silenes-dioicae]|uniref:DNA replication ATP-dependent helicase/nuclease n=1 Tax=Microbotryum silenes-dioicae TaxID=796604 RepID=A0A2X0N564_9BASI|nr:BQ5605_C005g03616 [Microbotryum silenes-dioicae]